MSKKEIGRIERFIKATLIQSDSPVDLSPIYDLFEVKEVPFSKSTYGFAFEYGKAKLIGINENLHPFQKRMVLAHEASHCILKHPNSLFLCEINSWWYSKTEMMAQQGAALMLLPLKPVFQMLQSDASTREIQDIFHAPEELVILRLRMANLLV